MKLDKAKRRDKKARKARYGMGVSGRSIFTIVRAQIKRAEEIKKAERIKKANARKKKSKKKRGRRKWQL